MPVCERQSACKPRRQYVKRVRVVRVVMTMCVTGLCRTATGKGGPCHESGVCGPCGSPEVPTLVRIQRTYSRGAARVSGSNGEGTREHALTMRRLHHHPQRSCAGGAKGVMIGRAMASTAQVLLDACCGPPGTTRGDTRSTSERGASDGVRWWRVDRDKKIRPS